MSQDKHLVTLVVLRPLDATIFNLRTARAFRRNQMITCGGYYQVLNLLSSLAQPVNVSLRFASYLQAPRTYVYTALTCCGHLRCSWLSCPSSSSFLSSPSPSSSSHFLKTSS